MVCIFFVMNSQKIKKIFQHLLLFYILTSTYSIAVNRFNECDRFRLIHDCYYFPCLDAHYSCGRDSHLARFAYDLCLLTSRKYNARLTTRAQIFFNRTNMCAMTTLSNQLVHDKISATFTCTHLQAMIFTIYSNCFQNDYDLENVESNDICSIICDNLQTMIDLFLNLSDVYINLYQLLSEAGRSCGAIITESGAHTVPSLLISICLDRKNAHLERDITDIMFSSRFEQQDYDWIS